MNPDNIAFIPERVDLELTEAVMPEPLEAWTLMDFTGLELIRLDDGDLD